MWIRSQNRAVLGYYKKFEVEGNKVMGFMDGIDKVGSILGDYESQERALEVMFKIQGTIMNGRITNEFKEDGTIRRKDYTFFMPNK